MSAADSGYPLSVSVEGLVFSYSLTEEDLRKVFSRYGRLGGVELLGASKQNAIVTFVHVQDAELAVRDLNNKVLTGVHGRLLVNWLIESQERESSGLFDLIVNEQQPSSITPTLAGYSSSPDFPSVYPGGEVRKYTARFDIAIDNDKDFQVARRLIGVKGSNMKQINKETDAKLRLRGRGSGYLEGLSKTESPEPLHLCVSCINQEGYRKAINMVSELLESVYEDYRKFCKNKNLPIPAYLKVNLREFPLVAHATAPDSPTIIAINNPIEFS
jgi:hypothetical protein